MATIRIGADPEGFIVNKAGEFIPAFGFVPGDKQNPFKLDGGAVQVDGLAVEFNIDPVTNEEDFNKNIVKVVSQIDEMVKSVDSELNLLWTPVARFRKAQWDMSPEQQKILGCDPDYNVEGQVNPNPSEKLENEPLRTAAGHIHIGWLDNLIEDVNDNAHFQLCLEVAQGFHSAGLSTYVPHTEEEYERLSYYGHSGAWRPKKYGVELRAPSNLWVRSEASRKLIFNETRKHFNELTGL